MQDGLLDYILLPFHVYRFPRRFGTIGIVEIPSVLFLFVFGYPFVRKTKPLSVLAFTTLSWFVLWALGSQQTRFMLPLFPGLSVLSAWVMQEIISHIPVGRIKRVLLPGLLMGFLIITLLVTFVFITIIQPFSVILGFESRDSFLGRMSGLSGNYDSLIFIQEHLPPEAKVLMMWDGQSYYCNGRCIPDSDNSSWTYLVLSTGDTGTLAKRMEKMGVTHLLLNLGNADFILKHDPLGHHLKAATFFRDEFRPACTKEVYRDQGSRIYELTCMR